MLQERFEVVLVVEDHAATLPDGSRGAAEFLYLGVGRLLEEQRAGTPGLEDAPVTFAAQGAVEDDPRLTQQGAIQVAVDALLDHHLPAPRQLSEPSQRGQPLALHG